MTLHDSVMPCESARLLLGVYALGLASPDEQQQVDDHCATCDECARTRDELIGVVPMLGLVDEADATAGLPEPRPELLRRIIAETRHSDPASAAPDEQASTVADVADLHAHRWRRRVLRGTAAVGLVAAALVVVLLAPWASAPSPTGTDRSTVTAQAVSHRTGVHGRFVISSTATGSQVSMQISGVTAGEHCRLVVHGSGGRHEVAASWVVRYDGTATIVGHTGMQATDVTGLRVVTHDGQTLLAVPRSRLVVT